MYIYIYTRICAYMCPKDIRRVHPSSKPLYTVPVVHFFLVHPAWDWCASGCGFMTVNGAMTFLGCFHQGSHNPKAGMFTQLACEAV